MDVLSWMVLYFGCFVAFTTHYYDMPIQKPITFAVIITPFALWNLWRITNRI